MATLLDLSNNVLEHGFSSSRYLELVKSWINEAQREVARQIDLPTEQITAAFITSSGDNSYSMPSDFARIINIFQDNEEDTLEEVDQNEYDETDLADLGEPTRYIVIGDQLYFLPTPDGVYNFTLRYFKLPPTLADNDTPQISSEYYYLLEDYALWKAYRKETDMQKADVFKQDFWEGIARAKGRVHKNTQSRPKQVRGTWAEFSA